MLQFRRKVRVEEFPVKLSYTFYWTKKPLDSTNQFFLIKLLEDGLVNAGILPDDDIKYISETSSETILDRTKTVDEVKITIEGTKKPQKE